MPAALAQHRCQCKSLIGGTRLPYSRSGAYVDMLDEAVVHVKPHAYRSRSPRPRATLRSRVSLGIHTFSRDCRCGALLQKARPCLLQALAHPPNFQSPLYDQKPQLHAIIINHRRLDPASKHAHRTHHPPRPPAGPRRRSRTARLRPRGDQVRPTPAQTLPLCH